MISSFTRGFRPTLCDQFRDQIALLRDMARDNGLGRFDRLLGCPQSQFALPDCLNQQFIAGFQPGRRSAFGGNDYTPLLVDPRSRAHRLTLL
jgi:hypothetical protein